VLFHLYLTDPQVAQIKLQAEATGVQDDPRRFIFCCMSYLYQEGAVELQTPVLRPDRYNIINLGLTATWASRLQMMANMHGMSRTHVIVAAIKRHSTHICEEAKVDPLPSILHAPGVPPKCHTNFDRDSITHTPRARCLIPQKHLTRYFDMRAAYYLEKNNTITAK